MCLGINYFTILSSSFFSKIDNWFVFSISCSLFYSLFFITFLLSILSFLLFSLSMRNAPWCEIDIPGGANIWGELYVAHEGGSVSSGSRRCEILMRTFSVEIHLHISQLRSIPDARLDALCVFRHTSFLFSLDLWMRFCVNWIRILL